MMKTFAVVLTVALLALPLRAQERILSYDTQVEIRADGSIDVTERIKVHAEGQQIRRGIYRDFPTRYSDRYGNRVRVGLEVIGVERNDVMEPWFTESMSNGIRINTGNDDFLPVPADYVYTFRYRTTRQLGFFKDHNELYWNAIGTGWIFPIETGAVEVRLPAPVPVDSMRAEGYTGPQGVQGDAYVAELPAPGVARYHLTAPLSPREGFTIVLMFPKNVSVAGAPETGSVAAPPAGPLPLVNEPTQSERMKWFFTDNRGVLIAIVGSILLILYMVRQWRRVGRDPEKGIVIARYEPRAGQTPAGLRFMQQMGYDTRCFTGDVLALAVAGRLAIHEKERTFKNEWSLDRVDPPSDVPISAAQQMLFDVLFRSGEKTLVLKDKNAATLSTAHQVHQKLLDKEFQPRYFKRNIGKVVIAVLIALLTGFAAFVTSGGYGIPAIIAVGAIMVIAIAVFAFLIRAPTTEGRALLDEIEGLKLYMSVAERQELASMRGPDEPPLDAKRYEAMLPFAVALGVEEAWTGKFTAAAGAAAVAEAAHGMVWYSGRGPISDMGSFTDSIGSGLSSTISSASSPPGSSSGGGGGGFSGGGGGGGGGGGR